MSWGQFSGAWLMIFVCGLLMLIVLIQRGRGGGLSGAFGGTGGGGGAFGAKTGDVFTWITVVVATLFVLLGIGLNYAFDVKPPPVAPVITTAPVTPAAPITTTTTDPAIKIDTIPIPSGDAAGTAPEGKETPPAGTQPTGTEPAGTKPAGGSTKDGGAGVDKTGDKAGDAAGGETPADAEKQPDSAKGGSDAATPDAAKEPKKPDAETGDGEDAPGS